MLSVVLLALNNIELCLMLAIVLFVVAGVIRAIGRSVDGALVAFGLAVLALAFIIDP